MTATTNSSGVATFTNLSITGTGRAGRSSFGSAALAGAVSGTVNVTAGSATQLSMSSQPSAGAQSGSRSRRSRLSSLQDASSNS